MGGRSVANYGNDPSQLFGSEFEHKISPKSISITCINIANQHLARPLTLLGPFL